MKRQDLLQTKVHVDIIKYNLTTDEIAFIESVEIVYSDHEIMAKFGELKGTLELQGTRIDDADLIIAATALCRNAVLATGNVKHFERIDGLRIENWFV